MADNEGGGSNISLGGFDFGIGALTTRVHGRKSRLHQQYMQEREWQREDTAIQRRVADAQAAGIHPLFALGASVSSGSPVIADYGESEAGALSRSASQLSSALLDRETEAEQIAKEEALARIGVLKSEAARNDVMTKTAAASLLAKASQPGGTVIAPRGQVGTPGVGPGGSGLPGSVERFGTPLGYMDADKRHADSEEVERRWGDLAQEIYGTGLFLHELSTNIHNRYSDFMDGMLNPKTRINSMEDWDRFQRGEK